MSQRKEHQETQNPDYGYQQFLYCYLRFKIGELVFFKLHFSTYLSSNHLITCYVFYLKDLKDGIGHHQAKHFSVDMMPSHVPLWQLSCSGCSTARHWNEANGDKEPQMNTLGEAQNRSKFLSDWNHYLYLLVSFWILSVCFD